MKTVLNIAATAAAESPAQTKNIVLVHGGFVDGSGWSQVYRGLREDGYNVTIVQNPTISLADDVAATKLAISQQPGAGCAGAANSAAPRRLPSPGSREVC
jgi:hypothetical protein